MRKCSAVLLAVTFSALAISGASGQQKSAETHAAQPDSATTAELTKNTLKVCAPAGSASPPCAQIAPKPKYHPDPKYPREARDARYYGTVLLWIIIDPTGRVSHIRVARSQPYGLDEAAIKTVERWRFEPAKMADKTPVAVQINIEVNFKLD
jgi:TonB family protein